MRLSVILLVFLLLLNGWAGLLQQYDIDDHLGINAETGDPEELQDAKDAAGSVQTGDAIGGTLLGYYNALLSTVGGMFLGIQPGVQILVNIAPPGVAEDFITWMGVIVPIVIVVDVLAYARGVSL
jgi:hypothetical protein